jgi:hypothetical protein
MNKKIVITGASGIIGKKLIEQLEKDGHQITIFTRYPKTLTERYKIPIEFIKWNCEFQDTWKDALEEKDIVINLAGTNLSSQRWNRKFKNNIYNSRILCTRQLVNAISSCKKKPKTIISASAVGVYGDRKKELLNEDSKPGSDFLARLCSDWETETKNAEKYDVRWVALRIGLVMSMDGGILKNSLFPFRLFLGGKLGSGKQYFPWIHIDDLINIIIHIARNDEISGVINCAAPGIITASEFAKTLGNVMNRPSLFPVPKFLLRIIFGEIANVITSGQNVSIQKLLSSGYEFIYPELSISLKNLLQK